MRATADTAQPVGVLRQWTWSQAIDRAMPSRMSCSEVTTLVMPASCRIRSTMVRHTRAPAPITSTRKGLSTEVMVGTLNGLNHSSVINCDNISTISSDEVGAHLGFLLDSQELELTAAIHAAFDLD